MNLCPPERSALSLEPWVIIKHMLFFWDLRYQHCAASYFSNYVLKQASVNSPVWIQKLPSCINSNSMGERLLTFFGASNETVNYYSLKLIRQTHVKNLFISVYCIYKLFLEVNGWGHKKKYLCVFNYHCFPWMGWGPAIQKDSSDLLVFLVLVLSPHR